MRSIFKKYFIPHEENDHKPHFLRVRMVVVMLAAVVFAELSFIDVIPVSQYFSAVIPQVLVDLTNESRAENSVSALKINSQLTEAARLKAEDMATRGYFAHNTPEGLAPWYWLQRAGYRYSYAGENLAVHFTDSQEVVRAWMNSPGHRANILKGAYTEIGIAIADGMYQGQKAIFVTQFFGRPSVVALDTAPGAAPAVRRGEPVLPAAIKIIPAPTPPPPQPLEIAGAENSRKTVSPIQEMAIEIGPPATETNGTFAEQSAPKYASVPDDVFAMRRTIANTLTIGLLLVVLGALILKIFVRITIQHPVLIANGIFLSLILGALYYFNEFVVRVPVTIF